MARRGSSALEEGDLRGVRSKIALVRSGDLPQRTAAGGGHEHPRSTGGALRTGVGVGSASAPQPVRSPLRVKLKPGLLGADLIQGPLDRMVHRGLEGPKAVLVSSIGDGGEGGRQGPDKRDDEKKRGRQGHGSGCGLVSKRSESSLSLVTRCKTQIAFRRRRPARSRPGMGFPGPAVPLLPKSSLKACINYTQFRSTGKGPHTQEVLLEERRCGQASLRATTRVPPTTSTAPTTVSRSGTSPKKKRPHTVANTIWR